MDSLRRHISICVCRNEEIGSWALRKLIHMPHEKCARTKLSISQHPPGVRVHNNNNYLNEFSTKTTQSFGFLSQIIYSVEQRQESSSRPSFPIESVSIIIHHRYGAFGTSFEITIEANRSFQNLRTKFKKEQAHANPPSKLTNQRVPQKIMYTFPLSNMMRTFFIGAFFCTTTSD